MDGVGEGVEEGLGRSDVVDESSDGDDLSLVAGLLPLAEDGGDKGALEVAVEHLREEVDVGDERTHEDDGHVGGVEQPDRVGGIGGGLVVGEFERDLEALEVDDDEKDEDRAEDVAEVGQVVAEEGVVDGAEFVVPEEDAVEELDEGALVLLDVGVAGLVLEGEGGEAVPDDGFGHVDGDEDAGGGAADAVALAEHVVEEDGDQGGEGELQHDEDGVAGSHVRDVAVHARPGVGEGLSEGDHDAGQFLGSLVEFLLLLVVLVDLDEFGSTEQLHDHGGSDDGGDTEFHEGAAVRRQDRPHPVEGVRFLAFDDAVERDLAAQQVHQHHDARPDLLGLEGDHAHGVLDFGDDVDGGLDEVQEFGSLLRLNHSIIFIQPFTCISSYFKAQLNSTYPPKIILRPPQSYNQLFAHQNMEAPTRKVATLARRQSRASLRKSQGIFFSCSAPASVLAHGYGSVNDASTPRLCEDRQSQTPFSASLSMTATEACCLLSSSDLFPRSYRSALLKSSRPGWQALPLKYWSLESSLILLTKPRNFWRSTRSMRLRQVGWRTLSGTNPRLKRKPMRFWKCLSQRVTRGTTCSQPGWSNSQLLMLMAKRGMGLPTTSTEQCKAYLCDRARSRCCRGSKEDLPAAPT